jgi:hypothetical protein
VLDFVNAIWRYTAAALIAGSTTAMLIRGTSLSATPLMKSTALVAIFSISVLFGALYVGAVILLHWGLAPIRQFVSLLMELSPSRNSAKPASQPV